MELDALRDNWDRFGATDPLWAVLSDPERRGGRWDVEEFLATGRADVDAVLRLVQQAGLSVNRRSALDFGCGVGRLSQALAEEFDQVTGIDIAASMIEVAEGLNRYHDRVAYMVNDRDDLSRVASGSVDFVLSIIVLQHMEPRYSRRYVSEFVRVLQPGGVAVFQVPASYAPPYTDALDEAAFDAEIVVAEQPGASLAAGTLVPLRITVKNCSPVRWPAVSPAIDGSGQIRVGNHWLGPDGSVLVADDGREPLPHDVEPQASVTVDLGVTTPLEPGDYLLEVDLVQEGIGWFAQRGSHAVRIPLTIVAPVNASESPPPGGPQMEMYALSEDEVRGVVTAAGGEVVLVEEDGACGPSWRSLRYVVTPAPVGRRWPRRLRR